MLIDFRVSNYRSFRDPQELSLRRSRRMRVDNGLGRVRPDVSSVAAVYGPNAGGKSTLVDSIRFATRVVTDSYRRWETGQPTLRAPFMLDVATLNEPTEFEFEFLAGDGNEYQFGFQLDDERIVGEWLYVYRTANRSLLYERTLSEIQFGNSFRGERKMLASTATARPNALTLSAAAQAGIDSIEAPYRWFRSLRVLDARTYADGLKHVVRRIENDPRAAQRLVRVLSQADLGIASLDVREPEISEETVAQAIEVARVLRKDFSPSPEKVMSDFKRSQREVTLAHQGAEGAISFPIGWESEGTKALLSFSLVMLDALDQGTTVVIDEIDTSLHPVIVAEMVSAFCDSRINPKQAQLIFTTHDVSLLAKQVAGRRLLERDQIWLVEKDASGASSLLGLSEYQAPRTEENIERGYLTGRYGGLPIVSMFDSAWISEDDNQPASSEAHPA